jgi:hypothetical protein
MKRKPTFGATANTAAESRISATPSIIARRRPIASLSDPNRSSATMSVSG